MSSIVSHGHLEINVHTHAARLQFACAQGDNESGEYESG